MTPNKKTCIECLDLQTITLVGVIHTSDFTITEFNLKEQDKIKYSIGVTDEFYMVNEMYHYLTNIIRKQLPHQRAICGNCNEYHDYRSKFIHCYFKDILPTIIPIQPAAIKHIDLLDAATLNRISQYRIHNKIAIYTDASKIHLNGLVSYVIITPDDIYIESFDVADLKIDSSTRSEVIAQSMSQYVCASLNATMSC